MKWKVKPSYFAALACMQVFSGSPAVDALYKAHSAVTAFATATRGTATNLPPVLAQQLTPLIEQGFYIISWETSRTGTSYAVDLYHPNPAKLASDRDDFREAASRGLGINTRQYFAK